MAKARKPRRIKTPEELLREVVKNALRRVYGRSPAHRSALEAVKTVTYIGGHKRCWYRCCDCGGTFMRKEIHVDHKDPVCSVYTAWVSYDDFVERLFVGPEGLQIICKACHHAKSAAENAERRDNAKEQAAV